MTNKILRHLIESDKKMGKLNERIEKTNIRINKITKIAERCNTRFEDLNRKNRRIFGFIIMYSANKNERL